MKMLTKEQICIARNVSIRRILIGSGAVYKFVEGRHPYIAGRSCPRLHVQFREREFLFLVKDHAWLDELVPKNNPRHKGNGAIDFLMHLTNMNFADAVQTCLNIDTTVSK